MKHLVAAIVLALLVLKLVLLLPAEAADRAVSAKGAVWQSAAMSVDPASSVTLGASPAAVSGAAQGQVVVTARIQPVRLLVVADDGNLAEVWSNGDGPARLEARRSSRNGPEAPLTDALRAAYDRVAPTIPPGAKGLVYQHR